MNFHQLALIALWTLISGPVFDVPTAPSSSARNTARITRPAQTGRSTKPPRHARTVKSPVKQTNRR